MIDPTITVGNLIEICAIVGGGALFLIKQTNAVGIISVQVNKMQEELKKLADVITNNAVLNQRILNLEEGIKDLRHWRGFVNEAASGEYSREGKIKPPHVIK